MTLVNSNARRRAHDRQKRILDAGRSRRAPERHEEAPRDQGLTGIITFLNYETSWGFIKADGNSYFFHRSGLEGAEFGRLTVGDHVTFEPTQGKKGLRAECVRPM